MQGTKDRVIERSNVTSSHDALLARFAAGEHPPAVIVIGVGSGAILDEIVRRLPATNVLAFEPSVTAARQVLARPEMSVRIRDGRLMLLVGPDYTGATDGWKLFTKVAGMPPMFVDPRIEHQFPSDVLRAKLAAAHVVRGANQNNRARRRFAGPYLLNTLTNLPMIAAEGDVATLFDAFRGVPAVVVAAGPSLDRNIVELKRLDGRALIIAVDTAVRPLVASEIHPHIVVSVDPSDINARHLNDLPDTGGAWLVAEGSLHPTVFPQFMGRTFTFRVSNHHPWPWLASQGADRGTLQAWGSVLTTAFDLALRVGCGPVVFAGADLAYTDGLLYCRNTVYEPDWSHLPTDEARARFFESAYFANHETCVQADVGGADVVSASRFTQFRDWLVARADAAGDRRIVNATGRGILHGGRIVQSDLGSVLADLPTVDQETPVSTRLAAAWQRGITTGAAARVRRQLDRVLQREKQEREQLQQWAEFGSDTVSLEEVTARAEFALRGLTSLHRGRSSRWAEDLTELMQNLELTKQLHLAERERDEARVTRDRATQERETAIQERDAALHARDAAHHERNEAAVAAFLGHYSAWRINRLRVLVDIWGRQNFRGATVLELGCGYGDIGAFFLSLGADVTFVDAREEHLAVVRQRYPDARTVLHDANHPLHRPDGHGYDYVIHMGLLNHLRSDAVATSILDACWLGRHVVLETEVCDSDDPASVVETARVGLRSGRGWHRLPPDPAFIERVLSERGVRWRRHDDSRLNTDFHIYDWTARNDGRYFEPERREGQSPGAATGHPSLLHDRNRDDLMTEALAPPSPLQTYRGYSEADVRLLRTFEVAERHPAPGFIVDFLGVRTRVTSLASAQRLCEGVLDIPVPGDYHAEAIEYVGVLQSVISARGQFVALELGAGWGPWLVAGAKAARLRGLDPIRLYGVEADPQHFEFMARHFVDNGLDPNEHYLLQAAVGLERGRARWPRVVDAANDWGFRVLLAWARTAPTIRTPPISARCSTITSTWT